MGNAILIYGPPGAGKTASYRNFEANEVGIFNASRKPLSFRKKLPVANTGDYSTIKAKLRENSLNCYILDDIGLTMAFYLFDHVNETGYGKFTQIAKNFYDLVQCAIRETDDNTNIYFIMHCERSDDGAQIKAKTAGKMIDNQLSLEALFSVVLYCFTDGKKHSFITQSDGVTTAKSPMEMFPLEIDNDLKEVDKTIREYYGMAPLGAKPKQKKTTKTEMTASTAVPTAGGAD